MYRGLTTFNCTNCGHQFKSHDIEYCATSYSVPQRCPKCGSVRTMPWSWMDAVGMEYSIKNYTSIWEEIEEAERKRKERIQHAEAKRKADEEQQRKKREKKAAKRSKIATDRELPYKEDIILVGPTWFPPDTPLRIDSDESSATAHTLTQS